MTQGAYDFCYMYSNSTVVYTSRFILLKTAFYQHLTFVISLHEVVDNIRTQIYPTPTGPGYLMCFQRENKDWMISPTAHTYLLYRRETHGSFEKFMYSLHL